jgi:hypothetical protein
MRVINLTPHPVNIYRDGVLVVTYEPSGTIARVGFVSNEVGDINGVPVSVTGFGHTTDLPSQEEDTIFIVSLLVRQANPDRKDLVNPDGPIYSEQNPRQVIGCRGFSINQ